MKYIIASTILFFSLMSVTPAAETIPGTSYGAKTVEKPDWFKESFLEFEQDVAEAAEAGRRVMIYFYQAGCPYCARLINENFADPEIESYIRKHFDGITINLWGDREVISVAGQDFTEKTFSAALKVQYTPTMIFLDEQGKVALRLSGYYPPDDFRSALSYVAEHLEKEMSFAQYRAKLDKSPSNDLIAEDFYLAETNLEKIIDQSESPLAVYFETGNCTQCKTMHERVLVDKATRKLVKKMNNVQFGIYSTNKLTTPKGIQTTALAWAQDLGITYTPSVVFFNSDGDEVMRISAFLKTFHFQSVQAYVLDKAYIEQPSFQRYIAARAESIRAQGFDTDIWGYQSSYE